MPYRVDVLAGVDDALDRLVDLGALDVDVSDDGRIAAVLPDSVAPEQVAHTLGVADVSVSPATGRDADSVWVLSRRPIRVGRLHILPADALPQPGALRLIDGPAFGTGLHPTTALCLEALQDLVYTHPEALLDVGTGSGVLALAALMLGVPRAVGIDIDQEALRSAAENARLNGLEHRLQLMRAEPATLTGTWPLVVANVLAAPLIDMAPSLIRRLGHQGDLVLSGIAESVEDDVLQAFRRLGMRSVATRSRGGWVVLVLQASW